MHGLVRGHRDVAVTPHHLSANVAMAVMGSGGNAADAAIAATVAQGVVAPETCGIGGDLFALVHVPGDPLPYCLNASGRAGSNVDPARVQAEEMPLFGPQAITVPGCVAGLLELHERFGSLPFDRLLAPAISYAQDGFFVSEALAATLARRGDELVGQEIAKTLMPGGAPPKLESLLRRPDLARTLMTVAREGRDGFYRGHVALAMSRSIGVGITLEDLADYEPEWVRPLSKELFGRTAWTVPPNSQGYVTLAALRILEMLDAPAHGPELTHLQVEAYRAVAWDRDDLVADPDHAPLPMDELVDDERLAPRAARIDRNRASAWPADSEPEGGTAFLAFVDEAGMGVSLIQSNFHGLGTTIGAGDAGFLLHNRGGSFTLTPGHPNQLAPGKRPLHTLSPTLWTNGGELDTILGTRGGHQQPQLLAQVAWSLFKGAADPEAAQAVPRWTTKRFGPGDASSVRLEEGGETALALRAAGHDVEVLEAPQGGWGPVAIIQVNSDGLRSGAPDPRVRVSSAQAS